MPTSNDPLNLIAKIEFLPELEPGADRQRLDFPHLSNSQLNSISSCGVAYWFSRIVGIPTPLVSQIVKGSAFHDGMARFFVDVRDGLLSTQEMIARAQATARAYIERTLQVKNNQATAIIQYGPRWYRGPLDSLQTMILDVEAAIAYICQHPEIVKLRPLSVENGYIIHWNDSQILPFVGYTDLVHALGENAAITDLKTGGRVKGDFALAMDLAQIGYAFGAQAGHGRPVTDISYASLGWEPASTATGPANVSFSLQSLPFDPSRLTRLHKRCEDASIDLRDQRFRLTESDYACPTCPFRYPCSQRFGTLDAAVLDSATFANGRESVIDISAIADDLNFNGSPNGLSQKQYDWIGSMLLQAGIDLPTALQAARMPVVEDLALVDKRGASKLIDYLKPVAESAQAQREQTQRADRQIAQAQASLSGLQPERATVILERYGLAEIADLTNTHIAGEIMREAGELHLERLQHSAQS